MSVLELVLGWALVGCLAAWVAFWVVVAVGGIAGVVGEIRGVVGRWVRSEARSGARGRTVRR